MSRTSIYWSLVDGGVKAVVQERSLVSSAVSESLRKMMDLVTLRSRFQPFTFVKTYLINRFITFTKIGSGMSYEDYEWIL